MLYAVIVFTGNTKTSTDSIFTEDLRVVIPNKNRTTGI